MIEKLVSKLIQELDTHHVVECPKCEEQHFMKLYSLHVFPAEACMHGTASIKHECPHCHSSVELEFRW